MPAAAHCAKAAHPTDLQQCDQGTCCCNTRSCWSCWCNEARCREHTCRMNCTQQIWLHIFGNMMTSLLACDAWQQPGSSVHAAATTGNALAVMAASISSCGLQLRDYRLRSCRCVYTGCTTVVATAVWARRPMSAHSEAWDAG